MNHLEKTSQNHYKIRKSHHRNLFCIKKLIFSPISDDKIPKLMIDDESIKYITFASAAQKISNIIMNSLNNFPCPLPEREMEWRHKKLVKKMAQLVITDMTSGVGGNVLNFARYFKYVNAIEIDRKRYIFLNNNVQVYGFDNVNCYYGDSVQLLIEKDDLVQDIVFMDPPWGGRDYKLHHNLRLKLSNHPIEHICNLLFMKERNKMVVLKLPNNYDFDFLYGELRNYSISKYPLERMTIVVVKNYEDLSEIY